MERRFSKKYDAFKLNDQLCFMSPGGTVFHFVVLVPFHSLVVEYANSIEEARASLFEDGDQFDIDVDFEELIAEVNQELQSEVA